MSSSCSRIQATQRAAALLGVSTIELMEMVRQERFLPKPEIVFVSKKPKQSDVLIIKEIFRDMERPIFQPRARLHYGLAYIEEVTPFTQEDWDKLVERLNRLH